MLIRPREAVLLLCDGIIREAGTNKPHLHGLFDRIQVASFPAALNCWLFVRFYLEAIGSAALSLEIERPGGARETMIGAFEFRGAEEKFEGQIQIQGFPLFAQGLHRIHVCMDATPIVTTSFHVATAAPQIRVVN